ncbi:MAG: pyridoxal-phosphate dependent enzyme [Schleiferiaceae bacterium]|nr:pyridoxal-phosphate dependent enzyme [Schleiferiaceae bacterium]
MNKIEIERAHQRVEPHVHRTPVLTNSFLNELIGASLYFKAENFQKVGAFKARGAINALSQLDKSIEHVATHSSGNHAQALAWGAKKLGMKATIVMPKNSPQVKVDAVKGYGAEIVLCKPTLEARESTLQEVLAKTPGKFIPPYNHEHIICGAATAAKELLEDSKDIEAIIAPVGGGGLLSGTALSSKHFASSIKVYGAEPKMADDAQQSFRVGKLIPSVNPNTIADGLKTSLGEINFKVISKHVEDILTVTEDEIKEALFLILERMKIVVEPSSAVALAVVLKNKELFNNKKVGLILSGGNLDLTQLRLWKK